MINLYIIENKNGAIYIGITENIEKRLESHNRNSGPDWTQGKGPWEIIYKENFKTKTEALIREKYLKKLKAGKRIKQILNIT